MSSRGPGPRGPRRRVRRGIAQPGSAEVLGISGRSFESCCPDQSPLTASRPRRAGVHAPGSAGRKVEVLCGRRPCGPGHNPKVEAAAQSRWKRGHDGPHFSPIAERDPVRSWPRQALATVFDLESRTFHRPLMGWTSSGDMKQQIVCVSRPRSRRWPMRARGRSLSGRGADPEHGVAAHGLLFR